MLVLSHCLMATIISAAPAQAAAPRVTFERQAETLVIRVGDQPFARYVTRDPTIARPFLCDVHGPHGQPVTRPYPPSAPDEATDHHDMHPGVWLAFGDLSGHDFWRNRATARHIDFTAIEPGDGRGQFVSRLEYMADGGKLCDETRTINIARREEGYLLSWTSEFRPADQAIHFGDQEEMGFGVRLRSLLTEDKGGRIDNSEGIEGAKRAWGKTAHWCRYAGQLDDGWTGVVLIADPRNFRESWFHVRPYGLLLANVFGRKAFTKGEPSRVTVEPSETLVLRYGLFVFDGQMAYRQYLLANSLSEP